MALARINALTLHGLHTHHICLEVTISRGLPAFSIVGLPDTIVKESRERIRSAIRESGFDFPIQRITINLAPANLRKEGPGFELPMAIGILVASGQVRPAGLTEAIIMGELGLNGSVRPITGMLPIAHAVARTMHTPLLVAPQNAREAVAVGDVCAYAVDTLRAAVTLLEQPTLGTPATHTPLPTTAPASQLDWSDVKGQAHAKRGLEIAAAGGHHVMMIGTPGSGKSMLAHRLSTIVPPLTRDESLEVSCIHSVAGVLPPDTPLLQTRVVRAPHHTASAVALIGGTAQLRPGEISLAHRGVLFLDELPEFPRHVLEVLRQPLEEGCVVIARARGSVTYPAVFQLLAAMNPCPCGYWAGAGAPSNCRCTPGQIQQYRAKISGPLLDRIDLHIDVPTLSHATLTSVAVEESSAVVRARVTQCQALQGARYTDGAMRNARLTGRALRTQCTLSVDAQELLKQAMERLQLSARGYMKVLKVARTIADLATVEEIAVAHVAEALQYRSIDHSQPGNF